MVQDFDEEWVRLANGFGGGIAEALDVYGTLVGTVMLIGALCGGCRGSEVCDGFCY